MQTRLRALCLVVLALIAGALRAQGAELYVALTGDDANAGDLTHPLRTISRGVAQLAPGDTLTVAPGTYAESIIINRAGLPDAPLTLRGGSGVILVNPQPGTSRSAFDVYAAAAYVVIRGFEITGQFAESVFVRSGAHDIELADLDIHHNRAGIWLAGSSRVLVHDTSVHQNASTGIRLFAGARDVQLVDVRSAYQDDGGACLGDADGVSADDTTAGIHFVRVQSIGNSEDGFDLNTPDVDLHEVEARANGCSAMKLGAGGLVENALISGSHIGINAGGDASSATTIINCTLLDNGIGVRALVDGHYLTVRNSIVSGVGKALSVNATIALTEDHNIFFRPDTDSRLIVRTVGASELLTSGADINSGLWRMTSGGQGEGTIAVDPGLDASGRPLAANSPAIDSGSAAGSPTIDLADIARPQGAAVDRGAFEYVPLPPEALVTRVVLRGDADGSGEVRLAMRVTVPPEMLPTLALEPAQLTLRGTAGVVAVAVLDGTGRIRRSIAGRRRVYYRRVTGSDRISVSLRQNDATMYAFLRVAGANIAAVQDGALWVDVAIGNIVTTVQTQLRGSAGRFSLP